MHSTLPDLDVDVDLVCWSRHRWGDVFQRVQHLMVRFARSRRVFFVEEIVRDGTAGSIARLEQRTDPSGVRIVVPHLPMTTRDAPGTLTALLRELYLDQGIRAPVAWYDTPLFLAMTRTLPASVVVYDCIDDVGGASAAAALAWLESELFSRAHLVLVSARSLYEHVRNRHPNVRLSPSSVDLARFARARTALPEPEVRHDQPYHQAAIPRPRIGYLGPIDPRVDSELVARVAALRPAWQFVFLAPLVSTTQGDMGAPAAHAVDARHASLLARIANVHVLHATRDDDVPRYLVGWDAGLLPYVVNDSTRFMSATRVPELLAAGLRVVATPVPDIVSPYGERAMVRIARDPSEIVAAIEQAMAPTRDPDVRRARSRELFLATMSWDTTFEAIVAAIDDVRPTLRAR